MLVHIIGEVQRPGEYRVYDRTTVLELLSKAGGPTEFSRLSRVTVRRTAGSRSPFDTVGIGEIRIEILAVNLQRAIRDNHGPRPPLLMPGDVVFVPTNSWRTWRNVAAVVRDVAVVSSAYFLYLRAVR